MNKLQQQINSLPDSPPQHFCIAPFQSTRQNAYGRTSPCAFGAGEWRLGDLSPAERWNSTELNQLRQEFLDGKKPSACFRCWDEEAAGKTSLRQRQYEYFPDDYSNFIKTGQWQHGPKTAVFKTSNVCNLACRSCGGWDTNFYRSEGEHYAQEYDTRNKAGELHNRFIPLLPVKHTAFLPFKDISDNLEKVDFFGGEPFLNVTHLELLEHLASTGKSKDITLFYSTNCTNAPTPRLKAAWNNFKRVEISVSIDGTHEKFEYMRWPGKWPTAKSVLDEILQLNNELACDVYVMAGLTVSILNVLDVDNIYAWLTTHVGDIYINMVNFPDYLALHNLPEYAKIAIANQITNHEALGYMQSQPNNKLAWKQFIIWMKRQDAYRNQHLADVYPELYALIKQDWDSITDLSEDNFYSQE